MSKESYLLSREQASKETGTATYGDAGGEQNIISKTVTEIRTIESVWIDTTAMTQSGTIKLYHVIDGTNEREIDSWSLSASDEGSLIRQFSVDDAWRISYTEDADEGADISISYKIIYGDDK